MKVVKRSKAFFLCMILSGVVLAGCDKADTALSQVRLQQALREVRCTDCSQSDSMWRSMRDHFTLDSKVTHSAVTKQIAILQRHQNDLYKILKNAAPYISYVFEQTRLHGLPAELALLPIVESEFNPNCRSHKGALGIWQIMPATAADLGLKNNHAYDGRRDIVASTGAALKYLKWLNRNFDGDWEIALAAYNWGPGNLQKIIKQQAVRYEQGGFWHLNQLPSETAQYVPKLLALAAVIQNPARYGIKLPPVHNAPQLAAVRVGSKVDLRVVAKTANMDEHTIRRLNPGYRSMATPVGAPNTLLLPVQNAATFKLAVEPAARPSVDKEDALNTDNHRVVMKAILTQGKWFLLTLADPTVRTTFS